MKARPNRRKALALMGASALPRPVQIRLHGAFGAPDTNGRQVSVNAALAKISMADPRSTVRVEIDSIGGNLLDAERLAEAIAAHPGRTVATVTGACMSAATVVLLACDRRRAKEGAEFLIHSPAIPGPRQTAAWHRRTADILDKADARCLTLYRQKTRADAATLRKLMASDQRFSADRAKSLGFVHEIVGRPTRKPTVTDTRLEGLIGRAMQKGLITPGLPFGMEPAALARRLETILREVPR